MSCPDTNRLIDLRNDELGDLELRAHLQQCPTCRAELRIIREITAAFRPEIAVPQSLVRRTMAGILLQKDTPRARALHAAAAVALGTLTAAATTVVTGSTDSGGPLALLLFSVAMGGVAGLYELRSSRPDPAGTWLGV